MAKLKELYLAMRETEEYQDAKKTEVLRKNIELLDIKSVAAVLTKKDRNGDTTAAGSMKEVSAEEKPKTSRRR